MGKILHIEELQASAARLRQRPKQARFTPAVPEEGVRLIKAFMSIPDPAVREAIVEMIAEQAKYG